MKSDPFLPRGSGPGLPESYSIRELDVADYPAVLGLNAEFVRFLSPMDASRLSGLHQRAAYARVVAQGAAVAGFLLAFRERTDYDSPNYRWFDARYPAFLYIDRVVVSSAHQGQRLGSALYADLFHYAREAGFPCIACEFDTQPPNEASRRFHAGFGFREVGTQWLGDGLKQVSLQMVTLPTSSAP